MDMPTSPEDVATFLRGRGLEVQVEPRDGGGYWASLTRVANGEVLWPRFGSGPTPEAAVTSAGHRYWVEQRPDLSN